MRLSVFFLFVMAAQVWASDSYSQSTRLTLNMKDTRVLDILGEIEEKSEFYFLFNQKLVDVERKVDVEADQKKIEDILQDLFAGTNVNYLVVNRQIVLTTAQPGSEEYIRQTTTQQQGQVTGKVTDRTGAPLPGVTVVVKGTTTGTITDANGDYSMGNVPSNASLVFSFVGMRTQEIAVGNLILINVQMVEDAIGIEEVVAIGYGVQRKATLTGSVSSVNADFIENRPLTNSSQAIQGIHGVYVNQAGGQPGADNATIRIRGIGTLNDNNPLVLVDGIESSLRDVNPNDIESISVLKDAASASIYGNRAANGVVLIKTKEGKKEKLKVELNSYFGLQQATYLPKMVSNSVDYMNARNEASLNEGQPMPYSAAQIEEYINGTDPDLYPNTDWYDVMFATTPIHDSYLRLSGGTEAVSYSMSIGYMNQEGVMMGSDAKKYSLNSNIAFSISTRLKIGAVLNGSYWDMNEPWSPVDGDGDSGMMGSIARALPIHPNILSDGRYGDTWLVTPGHNIFRHPVFKAREGFDNTITQRSFVKLFSEVILPFDINYNVNLACNKYDSNNHTFIPDPFALINPKQPNVYREVEKVQRSVSRGNNNDLNVTFYHTLNWLKRFDNHTISLLLGNSLESFYRSNYNAYIEGFLDNELFELNAGTINKNVGGTSNISKLISYFGRVNYNFLDKYLVEMNFRYDGSSRFSKSKRWGLFPSFSAAWRINEESFLKNSNSLSNLKLRFSWGELGNQNIALYSYLNNININQGTTFNGSIVSGSAVTTLSDRNITWETTTMSNVGLDIGLWNKLEIILDIFSKKTTDILARINVPAQVGNLTGPITNLYEMSNKGLEIGTSYSDILRDFSYKIGGNIAFVKNNVDFLNGDIQYNGNRVIMEGYPVNSWYLYKSEGIFQTTEEIEKHAFQHNNTAPGDIMYKDTFKDGKIDINDKSVVGRTVPAFTYGFHMDINYKGFDLNAFFQGVYGIDIYPSNNISWPLFNGAGITKEYLSDYWRPDNTEAKYPRLFLPKRGYGGNAQPSTFWLKDASYLRLKNFQVGYVIPSDISQKIKINKIRLYFNGQNLLTFSKWKLTDPEKNIQRESIYEYPTIKIFSFGCNLIF